MCTCLSGRTRGAFSQRVRQERYGDELAMEVDINHRINTGDATMIQFANLHNVADVAQPIADWITAGGYAFGEKDGIYRQQNFPSQNTDSGSSNGTWGTSIDGGQVVPPTQTTLLDNGQTRNTYRKSDSKRGDTLLQYAEQLMDANGGVVSVNMTFAGGIPGGPNSTVSKRADWSAINFQYWSAEGNRFTDASHSEAYYAIQDMFYRAADLQETTGWCATIMDDFAYWGTIKMWTGTQGYGILGNCECESSDYPGLESC